ncbi:MAG: 50S ribosomal protein L39e [Candidatus Woesearchaeota archaeon]|nr:MAG: 50S ribosomal protein L39e [Candidatus Woesearchaeota archaeon]
MSRFTHPATKNKLIKAGRQTRWAPFWIIQKIYFRGRRVHPGKHTVVKRSWRRTKIKV